MLLTTPEQLDADPYLLNTPSGTYDLRHGPCRATTMIRRIW
ncbi:hypothetical protein [Trueperella pyogenes]|nr:hypothetical protein [Trueperella pyogenes]